MSKWEMVKLKELCKTTQGVQIPRNNQINHIKPNYIRYLYISDFKGNNKQLFVEDKYPSKIVTDVDLVMANTGSPGVVFKGKFGVLSNNLFKIRFDNKVLLNEYLFLYLSSSVFQKALQTKMKGGIQRHLGHKTIGEQIIPLPPLETQKKIAKTLDTASELLALRKQQLAELDNLIKSTFYDMFGDPVTNEKGWEIISLGELLEGIKYGTGSPPLFSSSGYNFIRATNIKSGRIVDRNMKFISENEASKISKCKLKDGELIIVRSGVNTGDSCVITEKYVGHYAGYDLIITPKQSLLHPIYLNELINTNFMNQVVKPLTRRAAQPHINADQIKKLSIILPELELQTQFATIVTKIEEQKALVKKAIDESQYLLDSLMRQYFE